MIVEYFKTKKNGPLNALWMCFPTVWIYEQNQLHKKEMFKFCICFSISVRLNSVLKNMRRLLRLSIKQTFSRSTNGEIITLWYFVHTINATKIRQLELSKNLFNETVNLLFFSSMNDEIYERLCIHGEIWRSLACSKES